MPKLKLTTDILSAALEGFEAQKNRIDARIAEIRQGLDGGGPERAAQSDTAKPKRRVSAAIRRRMAKAQRLRWKKITQAASPEANKSAGARKRIAAAQKKRWAAIKKVS
jgi:hypothetical protein